MEKVNREQAEEEVNSWLDKKKVFPSTRENNKDSIDILIEGIELGYLTLNQETWEFTHTLLHPIKNDQGEETVTKMVYKSRLNDRMVAPHLKGVKADDGDGRLAAYVAALTGNVRGIITSLDSIDKKISMAIAVFFL